MIIKILADRFGYQESIDELRNEWIEDIIAFLGIDIQEAYQHGIDDPMFVEALMGNKIEIIDYPGLGAVKIEYEGDVIGEWAGPQLTLKVDEESGGYYYEIEIESWSILEEDIDLTS